MYFFNAQLCSLLGLSLKRCKHLNRRHRQICVHRFLNANMKKKSPVTLKKNRLRVSFEQRDIIKKLSSLINKKIASPLHYPCQPFHFLRPRCDEALYIQSFVSFNTSTAISNAYYRNAFTMQSIQIFQQAITCHPKELTLNILLNSFATQFRAG